jgi:hypothetical protein
MVKRVQCKVIRTVSSGGTNNRYGRSPAGSQGGPLSTVGQAQEVSDTASGPYSLFGNVSEGIVIDFLA